MPYIVSGEPTTPGKSTIDYSKVNYDYEYPDGLDLKPGSKLHDSIRNKIWQRARESRNEMSKRFPSWREVDKTMTVYIPLTEKEKKMKKEDPTKPVSIVIPYSYSALETLMTYMTMAFFQDPMFRYEGVEDSDTIGAMLMELVIKMHCIKNKVPLSLYTILKDNFKYGIGIGVPGWTKKFGRVPIKSTVTTESRMGIDTSTQLDFVEKLIFEGNDLTGIDPYLWLPDTSVASDKIQDGEFIGWLDRDNIMNMLSAESTSKGEIFNVKYLKAKKWKRSALTIDESEREAKFGGSSKSHRQLTSSTNPVDNIKMYVNLIPKDWGIGDGEYPEKWFFNLAGDEVITEMYKADHNHGMYPVGVASSEFDGYSATPMGRMELLAGPQNTINFLFNSHIENVRKAINDMFVVDPYLININDMTRPGSGKLIRTRRPAWGHGVKGAVEQLQVNDITRANLADSSYITNTMDRLFGIDPSMSGSLRQGGPERMTKGEFQGTRGSAVSRLQQTAMIIGLQFMQDIGTMFAVHTQQNMTTQMYVNITGRYEEQLKARFGKDRERVPVTPMDLAVSTDLIVRDGSIPGGNFSDAWIQMFQTIGTDPDLRREFDISRIFTYIASELGAKNVEDFKRNVNRIQPQVMPDDQVAQQAQAGNLIPAGEF
jgi:hypothetical protein